jgi:hypothetical protein
VPLESVCSCFINAKDEREEKLEVMAVDEFSIGAVVPAPGRKHLHKMISSSRLVRQKPLLQRKVDAEIPSIIKVNRVEQICNLL